MQLAVTASSKLLVINWNINTSHLTRYPLLPVSATVLWIVLRRLLSPSFNITLTLYFSISRTGGFQSTREWIIAPRPYTSAARVDTHRILGGCRIIGITWTISIVWIIFCGKSKVTKLEWWVCCSVGCNQGISGLMSRWTIGLQSSNVVPVVPHPSWVEASVVWNLPRYTTQAPAYCSVYQNSLCTRLEVSPPGQNLRDKEYYLDWAYSYLRQGASQCDCSLVSI